MKIFNPEKRVIVLVCLILIVVSFFTTIGFGQNYCGSNPVDIHGALRVSGTKIVDQNNKVVSFAGNSFFWSNTGWGADKYYNANVVSWLKNDFGATIVRAAMGVEDYGGYLGDPINNKNRVKDVVDAALAEGLYVIIDWHSHHAEDHQAAAISFFQEMAQTYGNNPHVIYEIYNEPLQVSWSNVIKPYAEAVIAAIRAIDPDNLIIVGTPTWSQDVDAASLDPITTSTNIAYTLHFYAATHKQSLRQKAQTAMNNGIALFATEWGTVSASGNGSVDNASTDEWMTFLATNDISHANWSLHDKNEGASVLVPGASANGGWSANDLTASGTKVKTIIQNWNHYCSGGPVNQQPTISITAPQNHSAAVAGTNLQIAASAIDPDGSITQVEFFVDGVSVGTDATNPYSINYSPSTAGSYVLTAIATDNELATKTSLPINLIVNPVGGGPTLAFPIGLPHAIPGTINATNFDQGGQGVAYNDSDAINNGAGPRSNESVDTEYGHPNGNVGWIDAGEWLNFTVDVATAGEYDITFHVASDFNGSSFHLEFDGTNVTGPVNVDATGGWGNFITIQLPNIQLNAGQQLMRVAMDQGPFNLADLEFVPVGGNTCQVTCNLSALLEGAYDQTTGNMRTTLRQAGQLPVDQPYFAPQWNYQGDEELVNQPINMVDWVLVSFRETISGGVIVRKAAILLEDGTIQPFQVELLSSMNAVHVMIEHRNHLPVITASPVLISNDVINFDFRQTEGYRGSGYAQKLIGSNWLLFSGNGDQNNAAGYDINAADNAYWDPVNGSFNIYHPADFDMNNDVSASDKIKWTINNGYFSAIPKLN